MKLNKYIIIALTALLVAPIAAKATLITLSFEYTDDTGPVVGFGSLNGTLVSPGVYEATSGNLTIAASPLDSIAGLYQLIYNPSAPGSVTSPNGLFIYDNLIYIGSNPPDSYPIVTNPGDLAFGIVGPSSGMELNFFSAGTNVYDLYTGVNGGYPYSYQFTTPPGFVIASVPSPVPDGGMTVALLGLSLVGFAVAESLRRKLAA